MDMVEDAVHELLPIVVSEHLPDDVGEEEEFEFRESFR